MMTALNAVLLACALASGLWLVQVQYQSRRLFTELEAAQGNQRKLSAEVQRLQADIRAHAAASRVEKIAKTQLQMRAADPAITQYVPLPTASASATTRVSP